MTRGEKVIRFIEAACLVPEGAKVGQPIRLADFQRRFILETYDNPHGTRRAYLSVGRKNGKTALIACLLLAHLVGPEAKLNAQIVSGALSRDQAALVFNLASKMVQLSPELSKRIRIVPSGKRLIGLQWNTEYKALAAEGKTAHGLSPVLAILDEIGQVKGPQSDFVDAITTSQGAHENPLLIVISTQAPTDADLMSILLDDAMRANDPSIVCHLYAAPDDCDLMDKDAWKAANPALGLFRSEQDVEEQAKQAQRMPATENTFRVLTLNQRRNMTSVFVSPSVWKACGVEPGEPRGLIYGGLDLSATTDLTAFVMVAEVDDKVCVWPHFWMPQDSVYEAARRDKAPYDVWVREGLLRTTPGRVLDYDYIARDIGEITAGLDIASIAFDRWRMDRMQLAMERQGVDLPLEPFGQGYQSMSPAIEALEEAVLQERLAHGGNPLLTMCAANCRVVQDPAGNRKLDKLKSNGRIDGMIALLMANGIRAKTSEATGDYQIFFL